MAMVKMDMFDEPQDRRLRLYYHINGAYALKKVEDAVEIYEGCLFENKDEFEIESVYSYYTDNFAESTIILKRGKEAKKSMRAIQQAIRNNLPRLAIANPTFDSGSNSNQSESIRIQLIGKSSEQLTELSREVAWTLDKISGFQDVRSEAEIGRNEVHVVVDRQRTAQAGMTTLEIANVISAAMRGIRLRRFRDKNGEEDEAFNSMLINLLMALALIYFLMAALFESLIFPAAVWTQILFAVVGVYWFFLLTGTQMSIMGMIGILILIGVVVNNGIVLIDYVNQLRLSGLSRHQAIIKAGQDRFRPILMTAGTTVLSMVPLCVVTTQIGGNGPPYFPMARAMVGGLTFSTLITLLVLPTIYLILDDLRNWARRIIHGV